MDTTTAQDNEAFSGFGYGVGLSFGILIVFLLIASGTSYMCKRLQLGTNHHSSGLSIPIQNSTIVNIKEGGLGEATLLSYPQFLYSQLKLHKSDSNASTCSVCLDDYKATDLLRLLPECNHIFHLKCVDAWLILHTTCPICRYSPLPKSLTPTTPTPS